jgi:hypothetical protein
VVLSLILIFTVCKPVWKHPNVAGVITTAGFGFRLSGFNDPSRLIVAVKLPEAGSCITIGCGCLGVKVGFWAQAISTQATSMNTHTNILLILLPTILLYQITTGVRKKD